MISFRNREVAILRTRARVSFWDSDSSERKVPEFGFEPEGHQERLDIPREVWFSRISEAEYVRAIRNGLLLMLALLCGQSLWAQELEPPAEPESAESREPTEPPRFAHGAPGQNEIHPDAGGVTYQQWLLVVTGETVPNAVPVSNPSYGDPSGGCTYSQSSVALLPCYNPLRIAFDVALPNGFSLSTNSASPTTIPIATLGGTGSSNLLWTTNSVNSTDGGISNISITAYCVLTETVATVTVTNEDGSVFNFVNGVATNIPCSFNGIISGTLNSSTTGDTGSFSMYPQSIINGTYLGTFNNSGTAFGSTGSAQFVVTTNSDFSASGTVSVPANSICSAQTSTLSLSSSNSQAQNNGVASGIAGIAVGDVLELAAANGTTLIWFVASDDNSVGVGLPAGTIFVTGYVVSGVCAGTFFYDAPFGRDHLHFSPHLPIRLPPRAVTPAWSLVFRN